MLIGRVSELTGATRKAIRHYESIGLIPEPQRKGSYRIYSEHDVTVIAMIRRAQTLGFSLSEIKDLVVQKTSEEKFPIDMACDLIDTKMSALKAEADSLLMKAETLKSFRAELVKNFT